MSLEGGVGVAILSYELEASVHTVRWEGDEFFDDFGDYESVHKAGASVTEASVHGLMADNGVRLRIRARGECGCGDWNEIEVSTLPVGSKRGEPLPLPRLWLQVITHKVPTLAPLQAK